MLGKLDVVNLAALLVGVGVLAFLAVKHIDTSTDAGVALLGAGTMLVTAFRGSLLGGKGGAP